MRKISVHTLSLSLTLTVSVSLPTHSENVKSTKQVTVSLSEAGTLSEKIATDTRPQIKDLKIVGNINGDDVAIIRGMAGGSVSENHHTNGNLEALDLSEAKIVDGGGSYCNYYNRQYNTQEDNIGDFFFHNCNSLKSLVLPIETKKIGNSAFYNCHLESIVMPVGITNIGGHAFEYGFNGDNLTIPSSVTSIGEGAFQSCSAKNIILPNNLTEIADHLFWMSGLTSITIPQSVTNIGNEAFRECWNLKNVIISPNVTKIGAYAFFKCSSLKSANIPSGVAKIEGYTFSECHNLDNVTIPQSVMAIEQGAFDCCYNMKRVIMPDNLTTIGDYAFYECRSLTDITIPISVSSIGIEAFKGNTNLKDVHVYWITPLNISISTFDGIDKESCTLFIPRGTYNEYSTSNWGKCFNNIVEIDATKTNKPTISNNTKEYSSYSMGGIIMKEPSKGLNIIRYNNGSVKKILKR